VHARNYSLLSAEEINHFLGQHNTQGHQTGGYPTVYCSYHMICSFCMTLLTKKLSKRSFMSEDDKNLEVATFRFGIISEFVTGLRLERGEKEKLIREKVSRHYKIPGSIQTTITRSTIKKWVADYRAAGERLT
jgi:hypothetical protein